MSCHHNDLACQVARLADSLTGFDWDGFVATVLATVVGAAAAALVSIVLYRHELRTRRRGDIDAAAVALIRGIQTYTREYRMFQQSLRARAEQSIMAVQQGWVERVTLTPEPDRAELDTAVEALVVITRKSERIVAERARQVLYELTFIRNPDKSVEEYNNVRRVLVSWRAGKLKDGQTVEALNVVDRRRQVINGDVDGPLPDSPEPYVRKPFVLEDA
ncbi:hypothetical protein [Leifsonia soli]|uniref:Uncharacterized protein n=1 Tax=Leifsonia soli TaxID=582665 RepID=A0A852T5J4_9MICO|nr:hypothetical protein [Leifsonia soli]NYD76122.1 hypothetical protein [Leifsonia soli]